MKFKIKHCKDSDRDHKKSIRQYAHVGHRKGVICVAKAFFKLPYKIQWGLICHEIGHMLGEVDERMADVTGGRYCKVKVKRVDSRHGKNLESL